MFDGVLLGVAGFLLICLWHLDVVSREGADNYPEPVVHLLPLGPEKAEVMKQLLERAGTQRMSKQLGVILVTRRCGGTARLHC